MILTNGSRFILTVDSWTTRKRANKINPKKLNYKYEEEVQQSKQKPNVASILDNL